MQQPYIIETDRLLLRPWQAEDLPTLIEINKDPRVMEHFLSTRDAAESTSNFQLMQQHFDEHGFGLNAAVIKSTQECIGFVGLAKIAAPYPMAPCVEIGWRLNYNHWDKGYATEGAKAALADGFTRLNLAEIVAFTIPLNTRSRRVMEKLGMNHDPKDNFKHPKIPADHPRCLQLLYRLSKDEWLKL